MPLDEVNALLAPVLELGTMAIERAQAKAAGLEVVQEHAFGHDYATTLQRWREVFMARRTEVLDQGFDQRFMHIWEFYLAYCEAAFLEDNIDVVQYTLRKPDARS